MLSRLTWPSNLHLPRSWNCSRVLPYLPHRLATYFKAGHLHIRLRCGVLCSRITALVGRFWMLSELRETQKPGHPVYTPLTWQPLTRLSITLGVPLWEKNAHCLGPQSPPCPLLMCLAVSDETKGRRFEPSVPYCTNLTEHKDPVKYKDSASQDYRVPLGWKPPSTHTIAQPELI